MPPRVPPPLVEVYLLVEQPRQRLSHWTQALAALDEPGAPPIVAADAWYEPASNQAIFRLRYDERALGPERLAYVVELAVLNEIGLIQAGELSDAERKRFIGERLARCSEHVAGQRKLVGALVELVRRVRAGKSATVPPPRRTGVGTRAGLGPQAASDADSPLIVARGTRQSAPFGARAPSQPQSTRDLDPNAGPAGPLARGSVRQPKLAHDGGEVGGVPEEIKRVITEPIATAPVPGPVLTSITAAMPTLPQPVPVLPAPPIVPATARPQTIPPPVSSARTPITRLPPLFPNAESELHTSTSVTAETTHALPAMLPTLPTPPAGMPRQRAASPRLSPNVVNRGGVHRANTVMMSPLETQRILEQANATQPVPLVTEALLADEPPPTPPSEPPASEASGAIYARYLRSGRWIPIRIGALSLKGATLMAGALPRVADRVDISLLYGNYRALVRGTVGKVSTRQEAAASGATAFTVGFELEEASRRQLTVLLTAARAANVTLKPPPPRSTQRFPVEWPVALGTSRGAVRADALDVSTDGMFVKPVHALSLDASVTFTAVLDDALSPVSGHARVVRSISDLEARTAGLSPGYGISIVAMADDDRERWNAFLARVEQRICKRVLIGASPARLAELQAGLVAAGYTVTGGSEPSAIAQLASASALPIDAALIDAGWVAASGSPSWIEALFSTRNVPCVTMHGDARRARVAIDRLLSVT